jgi:hypothetical protein
VPRGFARFGGPGVYPTSSAGSTHTTTVTTFYPGTVDQAAAQTVTVTAGVEAGNIVFTIQSAPAFRVSGTVVDESGTPIQDAVVTLMPDPRSGLMLGPVGSGRSDAGGRFAIDEVPGGSYRASASVLMRISTTGARGRGAVSSGLVGWSSSTVGGVEQPAEIVVTDADVTAVRLVARRPNRQ